MQEELRELLAERTRYDASVVEPEVLERWIEARAFEANADDPGEPYVVALPPPNVTGALHMGHALSGTVQDVLIRLHRMRGRNALWIYGTDHAGIATQMVVERLLVAEGTTRQHLGREAFVERVWKWRHETGTTITGQYLRLGASLDFRRERFTMDEGYARAVLKVFVELYGKGYLFRANRMINWSPGLLTAISDLEVEYRDVEDVMYEIDYPLVGGGHVTVATVRPVTLLGDSGIAVNPADERFKDLIGRSAIVPIAEREVPIVADEHVEIDTGTGALKVTPAHDPNDFEIGRRHGLAEIQVIGFDGRMTEAAGERFAGLEVREASALVLAELRERGLMRAEHPYLHSVGHCQRSGTRVEPLVSLQWFCRMDELAAPATAAVREGRVRFHPKGAERIFFGWMDQIRPWCVSRQLWWGHQLPVWYCENEHVIVQETAPERCPECGTHALERDPDVLDTWFSSALWPFATIGWPDETPDLRTFYPGHVLCTAREIINLWVARMMMMGKEFLGEQPFADVVIHSVVQAADGRRMSKSLGTGIDPIELIERFGADAVRYGLLKMSSTQDVRFAEGMIDEGRGLANKLWNAGRLILTAAADVEPAPLVGSSADGWVLTRLDRAIEEVSGLIDAYDFAAAVKALYRFVWNDVCDWYLEASKTRLYSDDPAEQAQVSATLRFVLDRTLRLCHPVLPHVTEELWRFAGGEGLLLKAAFPAVGEVQRDGEAEEAVEAAIEAVRTLRRLRDDAGLSPRTPFAIELAGGADADRLRRASDLLASLGGATLNGAADGASVPVVLGDATLQVRGEGLADALRPRLVSRLEAARGESERATRKLGDERFVSRAPAALVEVEREKASRFAAEAAELEARIDALGTGA
jgi:valyl-tRNA synthetase